MHGARKKQKKKLHLLNIKKSCASGYVYIDCFVFGTTKEFQKTYFLEHSGPTAVLNLAVLVFN